MTYNQAPITSLLNNIKLKPFKISIMKKLMNYIHKVRFALLLILFCSSTYGQHKIFFLTSEYTRGIVDLYLIKDHSWIKYPDYSDREGWSKLPEEMRKKTIVEGEKYLGYEWPQATASMYLEFSRNGNRSLVDNITQQRRIAYITLLMAELIEGKGRFMDDIINGVFDICEKTYWGQSAHLYLNGYEDVNGSINNPYEVLPNMERPIIDLKVGDVAADLAWTYYFLHNEFDKVSPVISKRLKSELQKKVLEPYYERNDFWWIAGWPERSKIFRQSGWRMNNWTPWITYNMLTCILLMEDNPEKKLDGIFKSMYSMDLFTNSYPEDGACMEGFSYWRRAGGHFLNYLDLLKRATNGKIDIFDKEMVKNRGRFVYRAYIGDGNYYISFANSGLRASHNPGLVYRFGRAIDDPVLKGFGVWLMEKYNLSGEAIQIFPASMGETFENLFNLKDWKDTKPVEPLLSEFYFPDSEIAIARDKGGSTDGFYFAGWGNDNGGGHNDNDVGSFILYYNASPILIDVSNGSSTVHNVPLINGIAQGRGAKFKASGAKYNSSKSKVSLTSDIAAAYLPEANVNKWIRTYTLERGKKFIIQDSYQLTANSGNSRLHFMSAVKCKDLKPGILELSGEGFTLHMIYNPSILTPVLEEQKGHGSNQRIFLDLKDKGLTGNVKIEIMKVK